MIKPKRAVSPAGHGTLLLVSFLYPLLVSDITVATAYDCPSGQRVFIVLSMMNWLKTDSRSSPLHSTVLVVTFLTMLALSVSECWVVTLLDLRDPAGHLVFSRSRRFWRLRPIGAD